ncbi:MAG: GTPase ObgE [Chloroflexota bacterium]
MIDKVTIKVVAGKGGDGNASFRREKFVPFGGPDGGDGGRGGDVIVRADPHLTDLRGFRRRRLFRAENGAGGGAKKKHGATGQDLVLSVPPGTVVSSGTIRDGDTLPADLKDDGDEIVVARGGRGGLGNVHFATPSNQAPERTEKGRPGDERDLVLEMRLIADVGVIGYPNSGKSTLLTMVSAARPRIAGYAFTTLEPVLGLVEVGLESFVLAEIPGLIEDAHLGRGLGHDFLRHALRTRVLLHLIDGTVENPVSGIRALNRELTLFDTELTRKPQIIAVNKIDLPDVRARIDKIRQDFKDNNQDVFFISSATGEGVGRLMTETLMVLRSARKEDESAQEAQIKIFRPRPRE